MPKSGKSKGKSSNRGTDVTDPLVDAGPRPIGSDDRAPPRKRPMPQTAQLPPGEDTDSLPKQRPLELDFVSTPLDDDPPEMDDNAAPANRRPAAARKRGKEKPPQDDAWASFDEERGDSWLSISNTGLAEEPSGGGPPTGEQEAISSAPPAARRKKESPNEREAATAAPQSATSKARLVALSGPETGRTLQVPLRENTVGRGAESTIVIPDASVSRDHARIVQEKAGHFVVVDRRSGNGTFVNGQRVEQQRLSHGDEVAFGNVALRFMEGEIEEAASSPMNLGGDLSRATEAVGEARTRRSPSMLFVGVALIVALMAGVSLYRRLHGGHNTEEMRREAFAHYVKGIDAFKAHQWAEADVQFVIVLGLDPQHLRAKRYRRAINREKLAEQQLAEARASRKRGDMLRTYTLAMGILDSTFRNDAQQILKDVDTDLEARVNRAQTALESGQPGDAQASLQVVEAIHPGRPDVAALLVRANLKNDLGHVPPSSLAGRAALRRHPTVAFTGQVAEAHRAFVMGSPSTALEDLEPLSSEAAAGLRDKIERFEEAYQSGVAEHRAKRSASAIRDLALAKSLEAKISGGSCKLLPEIDQKLADMYYVQGMQAYLKNDFPSAYENFHAAVTLLPDHVLSARKLAELAQKAQEMLDAAAQESDLQKIRSSLRTIVEIVPPEGETFRKAKARLDALP